MKISKTILASTLATAAFSSLVLAQDVAFQMPEHCTSAIAMDGMNHSATGHGSMQGNHGGSRGAGMMEMMGMGGIDLDSMPEHVQENMRRMMVTLPAMHEGMMMEDADEAFACGMIAHHQGAIDMAQVLLEHGDDPQMRALAEEIIASQVGEIEQMITWLAENAN